MQGSAQQINFEVGVGVAIGGVAGPEQVEHRPPEQIAQRHQHHGVDRQQGDDLSQDPLGPLVILRAAGNGKQRRAAVAVQVGEGRDQSGQREGKADAGQGHRAHIRQVADVDAVHHVVQKLDHLGHRQRHRLGHDAAPDLALCKIAAVFCFHPRLFPFFPHSFLLL